MRVRLFGFDRVNASSIFKGYTLPSVGGYTNPDLFVNITAVGFGACSCEQGQKKVNFQNIEMSADDAVRNCAPWSK
jgi:hypothetical protein